MVVRFILCPLRPSLIDADDDGDADDDDDDEEEEEEAIARTDARA